MANSSVPGSFTAAIRRIVTLGTIVSFSLLVLAPRSASALPPASGSKCKSDWVNNEGAMSCFIQSEEDARNGVRHPHYVACTAAGEIFCCVDDDRGNQNCDAVKEGRRPNEAIKLGVILDAQQSILTVLGRISDRLDKIESRLAEQNRKASP